MSEYPARVLFQLNQVLEQKDKPHKHGKYNTSTYQRKEYVTLMRLVINCEFDTGVIPP